MKSKVLTLLLSFVIAFALWAYVITAVSPNSEITVSDIKVILLNEDALKERKLIVTNKNELAEVALSMLGNRSDLIHLNNTNIPVTLDVGSIDKAGEHELSYSVDLPGVSVEERNPEKILVKVEELRENPSVEVKVKMDKSKLPNNFYCYDPLLGNTHISITGPKSAVEKIGYAEVTVDLANKEESINGSYEYVLFDKNNQQIDMKENQLTPSVNEIKVSAEIVRYKDVSLKYELKLPENMKPENVQVELSSTMVRLTGDKEALDGLTEIMLNDPIDLTDVFADSYQHEFAYEVPDGLEKLSESEDKVNVTVKFIDYGVESFTIQPEDIELLNLPINLNKVEIEDAITITLRGPLELVKEITESNIRLSIDLSMASVSKNELPIKVELAEKFAELDFELSQDKYKFEFTEKEKKALT